LHSHRAKISPEWEQILLILDAFGRYDGEFENRRESRSRRAGNEAEKLFAPESASLRRRLPFLNSSRDWSLELNACLMAAVVSIMTVPLARVIGGGRLRS